MQEIEQEKSRQLMVDILSCIDTFCLERGIHYSLAGGTLIGAIRHNGFIPWDDDIDIMMPRPDYDVFVKEFNGFDSKYECINCEKTLYGDSSKTFAKVHDIRTVVVEEGRSCYDSYGIFVDVFPVDGISESLSLFRMQMAAHRQIESIIRLGNTRPQELISLSSRIKRFLGIIIPRDWLKFVDEIIMTIVPFDSSQFAGSICGVYGLKERHPKAQYQGYVRIVFCDKQFCVIADFDNYLKDHYGDYMQLPPENKRVNHSIIAYWRK